MNKKTLVALSIVGSITLLLLFISFFGISLGDQCGYYNFAAPYEEDCRCIGLKTDSCPPTALCDKSMTSCFGIRTECYRIYPLNQTKDTIACKQISVTLVLSITYEEDEELQR